MSTMLAPPPSAIEIQNPEFEPGLDVLNAAEGHLEIKVKNETPEDVEKARKIIGDMLKRGYAVFVDEGDGKLKRVKYFSAKRDTYIVDDTPPDSPKPVKRHVPRTKARATGIAPTAGG